MLAHTLDYWSNVKYITHSRCRQVQGTEDRGTVSVRRVIVLVLVLCGTGS